MRRLLKSRCWMVLMVTAIGVAPACIMPSCMQTQNMRQAFLETGLSNPLAPGGWVSGIITDQVNPGANADIQTALDLAYRAAHDVVQAQIDVRNPADRTPR